MSDAIRLAPFEESWNRHQRGLVAQHHCGTGREGRVHGGGHGVEGHRGEPHDPIPRLWAIHVRIDCQECRHVALLDHCALGDASRSRCVQHVGQIIWRGAANELVRSIRGYFCNRHHRHRDRRQFPATMAIHQDGARIDLGDDRGQPFGGQFGINGNVRNNEASSPATSPWM